MRRAKAVPRQAARTHNRPFRLIAALPNQTFIYVMWAGIADALRSEAVASGLGDPAPVTIVTHGGGGESTKARVAADALKR